MDETPEAAASAEHGIAVVERRTGISQHVLRAWERRYGIVEPARNAAGDRVYTDADIDRLRLVRLVTEAGRRVGQVATLSLEELRALVREDAASGVTVVPPGAPALVADDAMGGHLDACRGAVLRLDAQGTHALLMRAAVSLGPARFVTGVVIPLLRWVGDEWERGGVRPVHEHGMSVAMRRVLSWLIEALPADSDAPLVVCATLAEQRHEFGAMLAGVYAAARQWRVEYLGPDLPADEIAAGAVQAGAAAVAVSVVQGMDAASLERQLEVLRAALPASTPVVVGGAAALQHTRVIRARGAELLEDLAAWDEWLAQHRTALAGVGS